jgi:DNA-binding NarL/FixJ family response regulator
MERRERGAVVIESTTVKYHLAGLLQKIEARDRLQAVLWGIRSGLIDPFQ